MIKVENITKKYGDVEALKGISFEVRKGQLYGLIGPDGSGKTSLFRILTSLLKPAGGKAILNGFDTVKDYKQIRKIVGYMPERFSLYMDLTVEENLNFFATVFNTTVKENYHLIYDIYKMLEPFKHRRAGALSGGMKQKLALSCALIHKPEILLPAMELQRRQSRERVLAYYSTRFYAINSYNNIMLVLNLNMR